MRKYWYMYLCYNMFFKRIYYYYVVSTIVNDDVLIIHGCLLRVIKHVDLRL